MATNDLMLEINWKAWRQARRDFWDSVDGLEEEELSAYAWSDSREHFADWVRSFKDDPDMYDALWAKYWAN